MIGTMTNQFDVPTAQPNTATFNPSNNLSNNQSTDQSTNQPIKPLVQHEPTSQSNSMMNRFFSDNNSQSINQSIGQSNKQSNNQDDMIDDDDDDLCPRFFVDLKETNGVIDFRQLIKQSINQSDKQSNNQTAVSAEPVDSDDELLSDASNKHKEPSKPISQSVKPTSKKPQKRQKYEDYDIDDPFVDDSEILDELEDDEVDQTEITGFFIQAGTIPVKLAASQSTKPSTKQQPNAPPPVKKRRTIVDLSPELESLAKAVEQKYQSIKQSNSVDTDNATDHSTNSSASQSKKRIPRSLNPALLTMYDAFESYWSTNQSNNQTINGSKPVRSTLYHSLLDRLERLISFSHSSIKSRIKSEVALRSHNQAVDQFHAIEKTIRRTIDTDWKSFLNLVNLLITESRENVHVVKKDVDPTKPASDTHVNQSISYRYHPRWAALFIPDLMKLIEVHLALNNTTRDPPVDQSTDQSTDANKDLIKAHRAKVLALTGDLLETYVTWWPESPYTDRVALLSGVKNALKSKMRQRKRSSSKSDKADQKTDKTDNKTTSIKSNTQSINQSNNSSSEADAKSKKKSDKTTTNDSSNNQSNNESNNQLTEDVKTKKKSKKSKTTSDSPTINQSHVQAINQTIIQSSQESPYMSSTFHEPPTNMWADHHFNPRSTPV